MNEISGFVSYFEEVSKTDRAKTAQYSEKAKEARGQALRCGEAVLREGVRAKVALHP